MKKVIIFTDGSSVGNPGPSGWAAILKQGDYIKEISGSYRLSTNNRSELLAVIRAIECIKRKGIDLEIYSDSKYVIDAVNKGWLWNWEKTNFKNKKNPDLWRQYIELAKDFNINMIWVKGHAENEFNNKCDILATTASNKNNSENWLIDEYYEAK